MNYSSIQKRINLNFIAFLSLIFLVVFQLPGRAQDKTFIYSEHNFSDGTATILESSESAKFLAKNEDASIILAPIFSGDTQITAMAKSTNGGLTWQRLTVPSLSDALQFREQIQQFDFYDGRFYLLVNQRVSSIADYGQMISRLFHSTDGTTWTEVTDANFKALSFYNYAANNASIYSNVERITFKNGKYVAMATEYKYYNYGYRPSKTTLSTSVDGIVWTTPISLFTDLRDQNGLTYISEYIGLSYTAAGLIFFSENKQFLSQDYGATWVRTALPFSNRLIDFHYNAGTGSTNDAFWLISQNLTSIYKSEDAINWTEVSSLPISRYWNAIDHVNGVYVVSGRQVVYNDNQRNQIYSLNGTDWYEIETAPVGMTVENAGLFLVEKNGFNLFLSTDSGIKHYFKLEDIGALANFDVYGFASTHLRDEAIENVKIIAKDASGNRKLNYNATVSYSGSAGISGSVTFSNGIALLSAIKPTNIGSNLQFTIVDAAISKSVSFTVQAPMTRVGSWKKESFAVNTPTSQIKSLVFENGIYNAITQRFNSGALSGLYPAKTTDGVNWTFGSLIGSYDDPMPDNLVYGDGKFLSVASSRNEFRLRILSGTDGLNYTTIEDSRRFYDLSARTKLTWTDGAFGNGRFVFASLNQPSTDAGSRNFATFGYSFDGKTINQIQLDSYEIDFAAVAYGNGKFIALGSKDYNSSRNDKTIIISEDGINWNTDRTGTIDPVVREQWNDVAFGNGKYVAVGDGKIAYSADGLNWTKINLTSDYRISEVKYLGGLFITLGAQHLQSNQIDDLNYNRILWSRDGVIWNTSRVSEPVEGGKIAFDGSNYIITSGLSQFVIKGSDVFSNDADLTNLQISQGQIQETFDKATLAYTSSPVAYNISSLTISPTASNPSVLIQVRNNLGSYQEVASGLASQAIPLEFGSNSIEILLTTEDGTTKKYTLSIIRELSPVNTLSNLQISQGLIEQTFSSSMLTYTGLASSTTNSLTVTPTATDPNSLMEISFDNGLNYNPISSAQASSALTLVNGNNVIKIKVTSQLTKGTASPSSKEYVLTVFKTGSLVKFGITGNDWSTKVFNAFYPIEGITLTALDANDKRDISFTGTVTYGGTGGIIGTSAAFVNGEFKGLSVTPIASGNLLTFTVTNSSGTESGSVNLNIVDLTSVSAWNYPTIPSYSSNGQPYNPNFVTADFYKDKAVIVSSQGGTAVFNNQSLTSAVGIFYTSRFRFNNSGKGTVAQQIQQYRDPQQVYFDNNGVLQKVIGTSTYLADQDYYSLAAGESKFLALSSGKQILSSDGLTWGTSNTWLETSSSTRYYWPNMISHGYNANGESIFVAFYNGSTTNRGIPGVALFRESDLGVNNFLDPYSEADLTTAPPSGVTVDWSGGGMAYGNGIFVAASETGQVISSPDGVNWTYRTVPSGLTTQLWTSVAFGNGVFMVISNIGKVITSPDGIVWREGNPLSTAGSQGWSEVRYGNGTFLAVGDNNIAYASVNYTDAYLKNLVANQGTISPKFSSTRFAYSMSVPNSQTTIKLTPTVSDSKTTLTINGTTILSGQESAAIALSVGTNTITIVTTNGSATQTYTLTITRAPNAIANLSGLLLNTTENPANAISYTPIFDPTSTSYTASSVNHSVSQITLTPTIESANATLAVRVGSGTFQSLTSGSASPALDLAVGTNVIEVKVTAEDVTTIKTYSITIIRKSNNADLTKALTDLSILVPAFDPQTTTYDISVAKTDASIKFTPTLSDANASMTINGTAIANNALSAAIALNAGAITNVVIRVTSEDGVTTKDYTFRVNRAALADADLSAILFEYNNVAQRFEATLDPVFDKNTQLYRTTVYTPQIKVRASSVDANATVSVRLNSGAFVTLTPGQFPAPFPLTIGSSNVIDIKVVAQDGNTEKIYSLIVTRKIAKPTITAINPRVAKPTDEIILIGTNFGSTAAENTVWFGSVKGEIVQATSTEIKVKVPLGAQHTPIKVINATSKYAGESSLSFVPTFDNADNKNLEWKDVFEVSSPVTSATYGNARFIGDLADLNGDGKLDIIKVNNSGSKISIYQNASTPGDLVSSNFSTISTVDVLSSPREVKAADLNNDGLTDLIVTYESTSFSYFINTSASNTLSFAQRVDITGGGNVRSALVVDVNNDGKQDIILYSPSSTAIRIFPNTMADESTAFALGTELVLSTTSPNIGDLIARDVNKDGLVDLIYVKNQSDIRVRLNENSFRGVISFAAETAITFGSSNFTILADDVQLDDEIDYLVAPSSSTRDGSIYSKTSSISITNFNSQSINSSQSSINLAIADLNGDGKPDLLNSSSFQTNASPHEVIVARNNNDVGVGKTILGSNFVVSKLNFPTPPNKYGVVFPRDLDLDGKPDILHIAENKIYVFRNETKEDPELIVTGTLNPFVICGSTASNSASQTITVSGVHLTQNVSINTRNGLEYSLDDQNYSTTLSIPVTGGTLAATTVYVRMNTTFTSTPTAAFQIFSTNNSVFVAASTSRESTDIVISGDGPVLEAATLQLTANVTAAATNPWVSSDPTIATIDANGLLTALDAGTVTIAFTSHAGCTATKTITIIEPVAVPITVTYFVPIKGKQGEEITITGTGFGPTAAENVVFFGTVKGEITAASATEIKVKVPFGARTHNLVVVNTNDHVSAQSARSFVYTFENDATPGTITNSNFTSQSFSAVTSGDLYTAVNFGTVGDLDGDGKIDLIKLDFSNAKVAVYKNQATTGTLNNTSFADAKLFSVSDDPTDLDIADLNNDGLLDLVITHNTSSISVLINKSVSGTIDFESNQLLTLSSTVRDLRIGDLDRDGKPDLVFPVVSTFSIYRNTTTAGSSTIKLDAEYSLPSVFTGSPTIGSISSFTLKDLNKDGILDIALSSSSNVFGFINTNLNPGSLSFTTGVSRAVGGSVNEIFSEDLNQDGTNDLFFGYSNSIRGGLIQNNYITGTITNANLSFTGNIEGINYLSNNRSVQLEVADFNGDAKPDLLNTDRDDGGWSQSLFIVTNNSAQGNGSTLATSNFVSNRLVGLNKFGGAYGLDLDNDKKPDWVAFTENQITLGRNKFGESPSIRLTGTLADFYRCGSDPSPAQSIDVRGSFLQNNISINDSYGVLEFSTDGNSYSSSLILNQENGLVAQTKVYVRFKSSSTSNITSKITLSSSPATTQEVNYKTIYSSTPITLSGARPMEVATTLQLTGSGTAAATNAWTSSNTNVATISSTGLVTSVAEGKTTIIYSSQNGCAATYDLVVYTKTAAPVEIASIVPNKGRANEEIEITGTGFGSTPADNVVYFGAVAAEIVSASTTSIKVKVPASALSVPITVVNTAINKSVTSSESFLYTFDNPSAANIQTSNFTSSTLFSNVVSAPVNGTFQPGTVIDIDGDRKADLVKLLYNDKKIRIYRNQTSLGSIATADFSSTTDISLSGFPAEVEVDDLNNDGKLDLVLTYGNSSDYGVLINTSTTGSVSFASEQTFTAAGFVRMMRIADLNNDGLKDLVMANYQGSTAFIHLNTTSTPGTTVSFSPETTITSSAFGSFVNFDISSIVVRDINKDGLPDIHLVSRSFREYYLILNTNYTSGIFSMNTKLKGPSFSGSFWGTVYSGNALVEDLNRDGKQDMLFGAQLSIGYLRQNNLSSNTLVDANFGPQVEITNFNSPIQSSTNAGRISIADFNGDGKPDIINPQFLSSTGTLTIVTNTSALGAGTTMTASNFASAYNDASMTYYASSYGIDLDQDGKPDIVSFDYNSIKIGKNRIAEGPTIRVEGTLSVFGRCGTSAPASSTQEFYVSGVYLTNDITIAARSGLEYSLNGTNFSNTLALPRSNASVDRTKIYVRMSALANSTSTDAIRVSSTGAADVNINATTIYSATNPTISGGNTVELAKTLQLSANQTANQSNPWTSSNTSIATVSNSGLISALAVGQVIITFKSNAACEAFVTIQVEPGSGPKDTDGDGTPDADDPDDDGDGVNDDKDQCANTPKGASVDANGCDESQKDTDKDGIPDDKDPDDDGDGAPDDKDAFPKDPDEDKDSDGDGTGDNADTDDDGDGVNDDKDKCPNTAAGQSVDADGCSTADKAKDTDGDGTPDVDDPDDDGDGVNDDKDNCADTPKGASVDANGCAESQKDTDKDGTPDDQDPDDDGDGTPDNEDAFPKDPEEDKDSDGDGTGDNADIDDDNDGVNDDKDQCPNTPNTESVDATGCSKSQQENDTDGDSTPDADDPDDDGDDTPDDEDAFPKDPDEHKDSDGDGTGDNADTDDDNDGVNDDKDLCPNTANGESVDANGCSIADKEKDTDNDGTPDVDDPDDDNDGVNDDKDQCPGTASGESVNANGCSTAEKDSDGDGLPDDYEANNQAPSDVTLTETLIAENSAIGSIIGQLSSVDATDPYAHSYALVSGTGDTNNANFEIIANELKVKAVFDFEKKSSYSLRIRTTDAGALSYEKAFTITIKDVNEAPTVIALSKQNIYEGNSIDDIIGLLSTTDQDGGDAHTYTLVTGAGSTDNGSFKIVNGQLRGVQSFNFATKNAYSIRIRTTDKGGLSTEEQFSINISKNPVITGTGNETYPFTGTAASINPSISLGYSTQLNVSGSDIVSYKWTPTTGLSSSTISNPEAKPKVTTTFTVEVTNRFGSKTTISITVIVREDYNIIPNNMMTPNGDGENDVWTVKNLSSYPNNKVSIFDRAGRLIYNKSNYDNDWNGQLNGNDLVEDTYYYIISINGGKAEKTGFITIIR